MTNWRFIGLICVHLFIAIGIVVPCAAGEKPEKSDSPAFGKWRGFHPGDFVVERKTFHGVSFRKDGVEYQKTVLLGASKLGAPGFYGYTSDKPDGPWTPMRSSWGDATDAREEVQVATKDLPPENMKIGQRIFPCRVVITTFTSDEGTKTRKEWVDKDSGVDLKVEEAFDGQTSDGHPLHWTLSRVTTGIESVTIGKETLSCLVQEQVQPSGMSELRWREVVSSKVPGLVVSSKYISKKDGIPEIETSVVAWGQDVGLVADYKKRMPELGIVSDEDIEQRRMADEEKRKKAVVELENKTLADLDHPDADKRLSAVNCLSGWPLTEQAKKLAIEGLKKALDDPSAEVRRRASWGLGQRGVKGMTKRILDVFQQDPEGAFQYLDALALQGDPEGCQRFLNILLMPMSIGGKPLRLLWEASKATMHA